MTFTKPQLRVLKSLANGNRIIRRGTIRDSPPRLRIGKRGGKDKAVRFDTITALVRRGYVENVGEINVLYRLTPAGRRAVTG